MIYLAIIAYLVLLFLLYIFIINRTKHLSKRHFENTGVWFLKFGYKIIRRRLLVFFTILFVLISLLFLTFIENDLLQKRLIHNDKKTLDDSVF